MTDQNDKKASHKIPGRTYVYFLLAAFFMLLPTIATTYDRHTGKILVASTQISEEPLHRSVIYIDKHNLWHSYGFIVNQPLPDKIEEMPAYYGGPVKEDEWLFYIGHDKAGKLNIYPEMESQEISDRALREAKLPHDMNNYKDGRFIKGLAGWGPVQLDLEIMSGKWDVIDYDRSLLFDTPEDQIWTRARDKVFEGLSKKEKGAKF